MIYTFVTKKPVPVPANIHTSAPLCIMDSINEYEKEVEKMEKRIELEKQIVEEWDRELDKQRQLYYNIKRYDVIRELELFFAMASYTQCNVVYTNM
jgi:hypothetical protein